MAIEQLRHELEEQVKYGVTSIQELSMVMTPSRAVSLLGAVPAQIRIRVVRMPGTTPAGRDREEGKGPQPHPASLIAVSGAKWLADGVGVQPLKSLLAAGIPVALGPDAPTNPYRDIMFAINPGNRPSEAITREQAVIAYTLTSAYAEFEEKEKGTIEPGKLADIAVLSQDIFAVPLEELPKTTSVLTLVGGKVVYEANGAKGN